MVTHSSPGLSSAGAAGPVGRLVNHSDDSRLVLAGRKHALRSRGGAACGRALGAGGAGQVQDNSGRAGAPCPQQAALPSNRLASGIAPAAGLRTCTAFCCGPTSASTTYLGQGRRAGSLLRALMRPLLSVSSTSGRWMNLQAGAVEQGRCWSLRRSSSAPCCTAREQGPVLAAHGPAHLQSMRHAACCVMASGRSSMACSTSLSALRCSSCVHTCHANRPAGGGGARGETGGRGSAGSRRAGVLC